MERIGMLLVGIIVGLIIGVICATKFIGKLVINEVATIEKRLDKFKEYYAMLILWLNLKHKGKNLADYFKKHNYNKIAIYGLGEMGGCLVDELQGAGVDICYAIDRNTISNKVRVLKPSDELEKVDVIVVTAIYAFDGIKNDLSKKGSFEIISLDEIVYNM